MQQHFHMNFQEFQHFLRKALTATTQETLAAELEVSVATISRWAGKGGPPRDPAVKKRIAEWTVAASAGDPLQALALAFVGLCWCIVARLVT